jgi:cytochrome c oxidase subunit 3
MTPSSAPAGATLVSPARRRRRTEPPPPGPPDRGGDDDGGGGDEPVPPGGSFEGAPLFGLVLALTGIATLFAVFLATWVFLRRQEPDTARASPLLPPRPLLLSTALILASSVALELARRGGRSARARAHWLLASLALGVSFLVAQGILWRHFLRAGLFPSSGAYGATFFALTGLHAAHVIGGIAWLLRVVLRARSERIVPAALGLCALYWHFIGVLWLVLFAALYFVG